MKITVLVPTYRRPDDLCRCLDALKTQERPADQVIVTVREDDAETAAFFAGYTAAPLPLQLEKDVWLGVNVVVLKGVTIGQGAVVGAGAIMTKSIPACEIWAGVPARKVGTRLAHESQSKKQNSQEYLTP